MLWGSSAYVGPSSQNTLSLCLPGKLVLIPQHPAVASLSLAAFLVPFPQQAELITDSFASPLMLNIHLLRTVLICSDYAWKKARIRANWFCSGWCV